MYKKLVCLLLIFAVAVCSFGCAICSDVEKLNERVSELERLLVETENVSTEGNYIIETTGSFSFESYNLEDAYEFLNTAVDVKLISKKNIDSESEKLFEFGYSVKNNTSKDIAGINGAVVFCDMFGDQIDAFPCDFTEKTILAGETVEIIKTEKNYEMNFSQDYNPVKLHDTEFSKLKIKYIIIGIVFTDGTEVNYG